MGKFGKQVKIVDGEPVVIQSEEEGRRLQREPKEEKKPIKKKGKK